MKLLERISKLLKPLPSDFTPCYACVTPKKCGKNRNGCGVWKLQPQPTGTRLSWAEILLLALVLLTIFNLK